MKLTLQMDFKEWSKKVLDPFTRTRPHLYDAIQASSEPARNYTGVPPTRKQIRELVVKKGVEAFIEENGIDLNRSPQKKKRRDQDVPDEGNAEQERINILIQEQVEAIKALPSFIEEVNDTYDLLVRRDAEAAKEYRKYIVDYKKEAGELMNFL